MKLPETESLNTYNCKVNIFKKKIWFVRLLPYLILLLKIPKKSNYNK